MSENNMYHYRQLLITTVNYRLRLDQSYNKTVIVPLWCFSESGPIKRLLLIISIKS